QDTVRERIERIYLRRSDTAGLIAFYRSRLEKNPNETANVRHLAALLDNDEAEKLLRKSVEKSPNNAALRSALIDVLLSKKDFAEAVKQCQAIDENDRGNADNLTRWGLIILQNTALDETQRKQEAVKVWQRISDDVPDDPVCAAAVADLCFRNALEADAEQFYRKAFELKPDDFSYREHLAKFYYAAKRKADVLAVLMPEADSETDDKTNILQTGLLLLQFGYTAECCRYLGDKAGNMTESDDWELQRLYIEAFVRRGKPEDIDKAFKLLSAIERTIEGDKKFAEFLKQEIELLRPLQKSSHFLKALSEAESSASSSYRYYWKLAAYRQAEVKLSAAVAAVEKALKESGQKPPEELRAFAAELYEQSGTTVKALTLYRQLAAENSPLRNEYLKHSAALQMQNGELEQALETSRTLLGSGGAANVRYYAELLLSLNRQNDAVSILRQGLRKEPGNSELLQILARTLFAMNLKDEAFEMSYRQFETAKDFAGKIAVLDTLCSTYSNSDKIGDLLDRLRQSKQSRETLFCTARVLADTGDNDSARPILEKLLDGNQNDNSVTIIAVLKELVKIAERQYDIDSAVRYQELLCSNDRSAAEQEHLFQLYENAGDTEKSGKLFLELVLRQSGLTEKLEAIDTMIRRKEYKTVLKVLDFFDIHEPENWQLPFRRLVILAMQNAPLEGAVQDFRNQELETPAAHAVDTAAERSAAVPAAFEFAATAPAAFVDTLALERRLYENILRKQQPETLLAEVKTFEEARNAVSALLLNEAVRKDFGGGNTPPAVWKHFRSTVESVQNSLPIDSSRTDVLLERLTWETILFDLHESEPIRKNASTYRQQINADAAQQNIRRIVRKLGLSGVPHWDAPLFQILMTESVNEQICAVFKNETDDKVLEEKLLQKLNDYCNENQLPKMLPEENVQLVKLAAYIVKTARTQKKAADLDESLTQKQRLELLTAIWTKYARSNQQRDIAVFENGTAQYYPQFVWLLKQNGINDNSVAEVLDAAAKRNPVWYVLKSDMLSYPLNINSLLFIQLAHCGALEQELNRLKPLILQACRYCNENQPQSAQRLRDALFQVLDSLLYAPRLRRYDIFAPHERELTGKMPAEIRRILQLPKNSPEGLFARQLFGWEPYPAGSQRVFKAEQVKRVAGLDYALNQLLDFAVTITGDLPLEKSAANAAMSEPMKPLSVYQAELTGAKPINRNIIAPLIGSITFADDYSPLDDLFFRIALLYRALDTKTRYIITQTSGGTSLLKHDYTQQYRLRIERLKYSTIPAERQLSLQLSGKLDALLRDDPGIKIDRPLEKSVDVFAVLEHNLMLAAAKQKLSAPETLAAALCKTKLNKYSEALTLLDSMDLKTAQDTKTREWIAAGIVERIGRKASEKEIDRGIYAVKRLLNYRLTDRELFDAVPLMQYFGMKDEAQKTLELLIETTDNRKLQSDILYKIDSLGSNQKVNASKIALRILENPAFLHNPGHLTAELYLLEKAVNVLDAAHKTPELIQMLEMRFRSNKHKADGKIISAKFYLALNQSDDAKRLAVELSLDPPADLERRQLVTSLLLFFGLQKELDAMNKLLTQRAL
ncbi:MAG: tetratricopeptide repeat protein, partial [Planctomycetaceae bacterium]|nr:tetratricopeptide repeat protein [Planctomycetaceae bacterium]